jgi:hypothetical protein
MGIGNGPSVGTDADAPVDIERYVEALTDTAARRHRLPPGTPEYEAALDQEERLMARIWRLGTSRVRDAVTVEGGARTREPS